LWQDAHDPTLAIAFSRVAAALFPRADTNRQPLKRVMVAMNGKPNLLQIIPALHLPSSLANRLDCWQQQPDQDCDDRNHNQQFNKGKGPRF
jgi:hypothetical protein